MAEKICSFKDYMKCKDDKKLSKTRKKINQKRNVYGWGGYGPPPNLSGNGKSNGGNGSGSMSGNGMSGGNGGSSGNGGGAGGMGESYRGYYRLDDEKENPEQIFKNSQRGCDWVDNSYEEEVEDSSKKSQARALYRNLSNQGLSRQEIVDQFQNQLQLTPSSATAYYQRIAREFGETNAEDDVSVPPGMSGAGGAMPGVPGGAGGMMPGSGMGMGQEEPPPPPMEKQEWDDPDRQGAIRNVDGAHLVYKRQVDDGSFEELWVLKQGDKKIGGVLDIRRDILAGTDIPVIKTKSDDGSQTSDSWNVGNIQYLEIKGLPN